MTVCIAARSSIGEFVVTISDTMFSSDERSVDSGGQKVKILNERWVFMYAGDPTAFHEVYRLIVSRLEPGVSNDANVQAAVESAYSELLARRIDRYLDRTCGMTGEEFRQNGHRRMPKATYERELAEISQMDIGVELLIAGMNEDDAETHIISADVTGNCTLHDDIGFFAIGSGAWAALAWLHTNDDFRDSHYVVPIAHRLIEAKFCAETSVNVGSKRFHIVAIVPTAEGCEAIGSNSPIATASESIPLAREAWKRRRNQPPEPEVLEAIYKSMSDYSTSRYLRRRRVDPPQTEDP
jgi:20S proteasome alpha/beta subunit